MSERKMEIEKRLQKEHHKRLSKERSDSDEKPSLQDKECDFTEKQNVEQKEIIKNVVYDEKEAFEPTSLTFEQKRLSFEKGLSFDKIIPDGGLANSAEFIQIEKEKMKNERNEKLIDSNVCTREKTYVCVNKEDSTIEGKDDKINGSELIAKEILKEPFVEEKNESLSFAEKRLSFEMVSSSKVPVSENSIKDTSSVHRSVDDSRKDIELFEDVSLGLKKLDTESIGDVPEKSDSFVFFYLN